MIRAKYWILAIILSSVCGFFLGRSTLEKETVTIARKEKTIKDTIYIPEPISIKIPDKVRLPIRPDTVTMMDTTFIIQVVDTNKIIEDYISIKDYSFNVFDDKYGTLDVKQSLQYNSLLNFEYTYTPISLHTIRTTTPLITPFAMMHYSTYQSIGVGGGVFINNLGGYYNYNVNIDHTISHQFGIIYKFQ